MLKKVQFLFTYSSIADIKLQTNPLKSVDQDILSVFSFLIYFLGKQLKTVSFSFPVKYNTCPLGHCSGWGARISA